MDSACSAVKMKITEEDNTYDRQAGNKIGF